MSLSEKLWLHKMKHIQNIISPLSDCIHTHLTPGMHAFSSICSTQRLLLAVPVDSTCTPAILMLEAKGVMRPGCQLPLFLLTTQGESWSTPLLFEHRFPYLV